VPLRALDAAKQARQELTSVVAEVERLADLRRSQRRHGAAVCVKPDASGQAPADGQMRSEPPACLTIADRDADAVAEMVLGVARDVHVMAAPFGAWVAVVDELHGMLRCLVCRSGPRPQPRQLQKAGASRAKFRSELRRPF